MAIDPRTLSCVKDLLENVDEDALILAGMEALTKKCHRQEIEAGWYTGPRNPGEMCALIHSEVSEAMEGFRKGVMDDHLPHRKMAEVEFADAYIRMAGYGGGECGFDLGGAIIEKLAYNMVRADHKKEAREAEGGKKF